MISAGLILFEGELKKRKWGHRIMLTQIFLLIFCCCIYVVLKKLLFTIILLIVIFIYTVKRKITKNRLTWREIILLSFVRSRIRKVFFISLNSWFLLSVGNKTWIGTSPHFWLNMFNFYSQTNDRLLQFYVKIHCKNNFEIFFGDD